MLLDNGRSRVLATPFRESLQCIRCGACLNACPVYRRIGGHAYGGVYSRADRQHPDAAVRQRRRATRTCRTRRRCAARARRRAR